MTRTVLLLSCAYNFFLLNIKLLYVDLSDGYRLERFGDQKIKLIQSDVLAE